MARDPLPVVQRLHCVNAGAADNPRTAGTRSYSVGDHSADNNRRRGGASECARLLTRSGPLEFEEPITRGNPYLAEKRIDAYADINRP